MAVAITATEQGDWPPRVLVSVTGLTPGDDISLFRSVSGTRTLVRAGVGDSITDTSFLRTDGEQPFGIPVSYVAVVNNSAEYETPPATYVLPGGKFAVTDAISGLAAPVVVSVWDETTRSRQASVFKVGGRNVVVADDFGMFEADIDLGTTTTEEKNQLLEALTNATSGVVQIRQPGEYDGIDSYVAVLRIAERRVNRLASTQHRIINIQVAEVEGWAPALENRGETLQDIANVYDVSGNNLLANSYFETNAASWSPSGGTFTRSTAQSHEGSASGLLTPNGVTTGPAVGSEMVSATPTTAYRVRAWVRCAVTRSVQIGFNWYNASSSFLSETVTSVALTANTWTSLDFTAVGPSLTAFAQMKLVLPGSTPNTNLLYIDEATMNVAYQTLQAVANGYTTLLDIAQAEF